MANPVLESFEFSEFALRVALQKVPFKFPLPIFNTYLLQWVKIEVVIVEKKNAFMASYEVDQQSYRHKYFKIR